MFTVRRCRWGRASLCLWQLAWTTAQAAQRNHATRNGVLEPQVEKTVVASHSSLTCVAECSGVNGHLDNPSGENWVTMDEALLEDMRVLVGATDASEVALASGLTTNLHNLMVAFYLPTAERFRIITDAMSFPTDYVRGCDGVMT